jgi:hypothetical protein
MSDKTVIAAAAILLGSAGLAPAQIAVFPQYSYWYGGGYYSPLTGTGVGIEPSHDYLPGPNRRAAHNWNDRARDHSWRTWQNR